MRIALITPGFSASERDWCIPALLNLVRVLAEEHEVTVFPLRYPHTRSGYTVYGARVHPLGGAETRGAGRLRLLQRATRQVLHEHRRKPFEIMHGLWADEPGFVATAVARWAGVPAVISVMGGELVHLPEIGYGGRTNRLNRILTSLALRGASRVTVGSDYLAEIARSGGHRDPVDVVPLGIDTTLFNPDAGSGSCVGGSPALLSVGSLVPVKDHATLLRAHAMVRESLPGAHLHIAGDGPARRDLEHLATDLGIARHTTFHGEIEHHHLPERYRAADLMVISSRHESQCLAALEAAACGCPTVGTAVGVIPELMPGLKPIPTAEPAALARAITSVARDPDCRAHLREHGLRRVREGFTLDRTVPNLLALYADLVSTR